MDLHRQTKIALDETRLLILGAQVLFGFQFTGVFQERFVQLSLTSRVFMVAGLMLIMLTLGLLVTPSMHHRIVERGQDTPRVLRLTTIFLGLALLPLSTALALDLFIAFERIAGSYAAAFAGAGFFAMAASTWYILALIMRGQHVRRPQSEPGPTPLETQVDQLLTEARLIIPGAQALLGFQLAVVLTQAFEELPESSRIVHAAALCCISLAIILLMAPASLHRLAFRGQDDPSFVRTGSLFVMAAPVPLGLGIALDTYVASSRALDSPAAGAVLGLASVLLLLILWYLIPLWLRMGTDRRKKQR